MSAVIENLGDAIANLTPGQARELRLHLEDKYGIEAPAGSSAPPPVQEVAPVVVEPTEFNVVYQGFTTDKIKVISAVREMTGLTLMDAKAFVEGPEKAIKEGVDKKAAEEFKAKLEAVGAKVSIQPV